MFGVTLKQQISDLKDHVSSELLAIRTDVRNAVDVHTNISPHFNIPVPVADAQLPEIEKHVKAAVASAMADRGIHPKPVAEPVRVSDDVAFLFAMRYNMEKELRRIARSRDVVRDGRRPMAVMQLTHALSEAELVEPRLAHAIREVYAVCSPAIHGERVTDAQVAFVRDVGPSLVAALKEIA